jgi:putative chitinase
MTFFHLGVAACRDHLPEIELELSMDDPKAFFDECRRGVMGPTIDADELSGAQAITDACRGLPISWTAYALATAWHETAHTLQPIKEYGGPKYYNRLYGVEGSNPNRARLNGNMHPGDGAKYCGRGYVQLTWRNNYRMAGDKLHVDLVNDPDLALNPDVAGRILRHGMKEGWFTGKRFDSYLPATGKANEAQFQAARRIINGTDKAVTIAKYAGQFQDALEAGQWQ